MCRTFIILLFLTCACIIKLQAQVNLVPNHSFEEFINCNSQSSFCEITNVKYWFSPNLATPDYYSQNCSLNNSCLPSNNNMGGISPNEGDSYIGIFLFYSPDNFREYISVQLLEQLVKNKKYCIKLHIAKARKSSLAHKRFLCIIYK
ncbi:MAG: hypothetical protein KatS3mg027_1883 [Bacteroidia bacterium]|nr:MAG: hypothetical protein KatS3mg027_1883 [Bacteroidia bacterium]